MIQKITKNIQKCIMNGRRVNNMNYSIEKIHEIDLNIFKEFLKICKKNNLKYYVIGGTFLGAIRHKGFIPWDDDMDIAMPRDDFEKFKKLATSELPENLKLITFEKDDKYRYYLPRIVDLNTEIIEKRYAKLNETSHLFIDIFPIDGTPNNKILRSIHYLKILYNRMLVSWYYIDTIDPSRKRTKFEKILIFLGKIMPNKKIINPKKKLKKIDNTLKKYDMNKCKFSGTIMGAYRTREIVPTCYFGKPTYYNFEGIKVSGPEKYDEYLTHMYGNYMEIPKNKDSNSHYERKN